MSKDDVRAHILQVAGEIFAAEGYQSTTIRRICCSAAVNVAAVNYYFGDKERLYIEAVKHARALIEQRWPLPEWPETADGQERLRSLIQTFVRRLLCPAAQEWQMRLLLREIIEPTRAGDELVQEGFRPFFGVLLEILASILPVGFPEHRLRQFGFSIIGQCVFYRAHQRIVSLMVTEAERSEAFTETALAEHIYQFSIAAIERAAQEQGTDFVGSGEPLGFSSRPPAIRSNHSDH